jgi:hypothetical protein
MPALDADYMGAMAGVALKLSRYARWSLRAN